MGRGLVEAESAKAGRQKLKKQGLIVTDIREKSAAKPSAGGSMPFFGGRVGIKELSLMTRQLASLDDRERIWGRDPGIRVGNRSNKRAQ